MTSTQAGVLQLAVVEPQMGETAFFRKYSPALNFYRLAELYLRLDTLAGFPVIRIQIKLEHCRIPFSTRPTISVLI